MHGGAGGSRAGVLVEAGRGEEGEGEAEVAFDVARVGGVSAGSQGLPPKVPAVHVEPARTVR